MSGNILIIRFLLEIAINHSFIFECPEISIPGILRFQSVVSERAVMTVQYPPIISTGIPEKLCKEITSSYGVPVAATQLTTKTTGFFSIFAVSCFNVLYSALIESKIAFAFSSSPISRPINLIHSACPRGSFLTPFPPLHDRDSGFEYCRKTSAELTAAGLFRIFT